MKVIAVYGSIRENSSSKAVLDEMIRGAEAAGSEVVSLRIPAMRVGGCLACGQCQKNACDCVLSDDLADYWKELHDCGALLLAAPNHMGQVSGPMITFMNRHYCMSCRRKSRLLNPVKLAGVFSQGAPAAGIYDSAYDWYLSVFTGLGMEPAGKIVVGGGSSLDAESDIMRQAWEIGNRL